MDRNDRIPTRSLIRGEEGSLLQETGRRRRRDHRNSWARFDVVCPYLSPRRDGRLSGPSRPRPRTRPGALDHCVCIRGASMQPPARPEERTRAISLPSGVRRLSEFHHKSAAGSCFWLKITPDCRPLGVSRRPTTQNSDKTVSPSLSFPFLSFALFFSPSAIVPKRRPAPRLGHTCN